MDTINNIELKDENIYPDESVLSAILDKSYESYQQLLELFKKYELKYEWRYYRDGKVWLCKVQKKKKTIVWMSAWKGFMQATIYFPFGLLESIVSLDIKKELKEKITNTKNVGKSKPCIFEVRSKEVLIDFEKVMKFKIDCR
ncbi:MAG: DUF3788 family protein [Thermoplasmatota archaeon]